VQQPGVGEPDTAPTSVRVQLLGPLRVWRDGVELSPGPRQQALLLALLLARVGRPTTVDELVDLLWDGSAPSSAVNVIHKYVGALRRLLEPTLPARGASSYLLRHGRGYLCTAGAETLDLAEYRELVAAARVQVEQDRHEEAFDLYVQALALWRGPVADGSPRGPAADTVFARLEDELAVAATEAARLAAAAARPGRVLPALRVAAQVAPMHEDVQAALVTTLGAADRQAEALAAYDATRARLREELGVEPGPELRRAHQAVLRQELAVPRTVPQSVAPDVRPAPSSTASTAERLVGFEPPLAVLRESARVVAGGGSEIVLVDGDPGAGKTALLEQAAAEAAQDGAVVVRGRCLEGDGAPSVWPWVQVVDALVERLAPQARRTTTAGELGRLVATSEPGSAGRSRAHGTAQLQLFEQVVALVVEAAVHRPLVIVLDDLQWADDTSLRLLAHLAARRPPRTLVLGALRDQGVPTRPELDDVLAELGRVPGSRRLHLGPLGAEQVAELVRLETGLRPDDAAVDRLVARTGGNPFFVRELARLLAEEGGLTATAVDRADVPRTVRDVVLPAVARLEPVARELLEAAALVSGDLDLGLLARACGLDVHTCLDRLEPVEAAGLLDPVPDDPFVVRFRHDLVREAVASATAPRRSAELHLRMAEATLAGGGAVGDVERVAHHLWSAGPLADPARTVSALLRAAARAAETTALDAAERHLRAAVVVAERSDLPDLELAALSELISVVSMSRPHDTVVVALLERAEDLARAAGHHEEAAVLLYSRWMALAYSGQYQRSEVLARRLLHQGRASALPVVRALGLQGWGLQQMSVGQVGDGFRYLSEAGETLLIVPARREDDVVWHGQQLSALGMLAEATALHGDVPAARERLDALEREAGADPFRTTVWAVHAVRVASVVGDADWALAVTRKGIAADPELAFGFFGMYQRLARHWALAVSGHEPRSAAAEVDRLVREHLLDPPRSDIATWFALLGEMWLAASDLDAADAALDEADRALDRFGQRYSEGLVLLVRARVLAARGCPVEQVRRAALRAQELATEREAHLFAQRAAAFLRTVDGDDAAVRAHAGSPSRPQEAR
jgi:DNA-binding SARP family transcriptional activator/tetratricopeptide (TPR) repeat protein